MQNIEKLVHGRRSVRTYDERPLLPEHMEAIRAFLRDAENPFELPIEFVLLDAKETGLSCPVAPGAGLFAAGKMKVVPHLNEAFGFAFEKFILFCQSLGVGTVWVGGTMSREAFEQAVRVEEGEAMPCMTPLGYPAEKMSLRETLMRKGTRGDSRKPFEENFFDGSFDRPLTEDKAGKLRFPLEMVRWAPSAVNKQPWRVVVCANEVHFFVKHGKGFTRGPLDMQKVDIGIALCHFALAAEEIGLKTEFFIEEPQMERDEGVEYIASYRVAE